MAPPLVDLGALGVIVANATFWILSCTIAGRHAARLPVERLGQDGPLLRLRRFEAGGRWYERRLRIGAWKDRLPEAGEAFDGGLSKRSVPNRREGGVERFAVETRRAERAHWLSFVGLPLTVVWNPWSGVVAMVAFGIAFNAPFIAIQRYNRARIHRILRRRATGHAAAASTAAAATSPRLPRS